VASQEGLLVNQHLGHAEEFWVFGRTESGFALIEKRPAPESGGGAHRWMKLAEALHDCRAVLASAAGATPQMVLDHHGLRVVLMEGLQDDGVEMVGKGSPLLQPCRTCSTTRCCTACQ